MPFVNGDQCYGIPVPGDMIMNPPEADMVIFVTAEPAQEGVLAWAVPCMFDNEHGQRPIAGRVNFAPDKIKTGDADWES